MAALLEVTGLTKAFGVTVVDNLSLAVGTGDAVGVVGPNGAGKTTMLNMIAGDLLPDAGEVRFQGVDITRLPAERRCRAGIARTSQIPRPFEGMSVLENVLVGATHGGRQRRKEADAVDVVVSALDRTGLLADANTPAGALPLLKRKRLELARALSTQPTLLLLDEIAGGLVEGEVLDLIETIREIQAGGVTIVWIEHIVHALLAVVDRIVAMSFGCKIAEGDPETVMGSPEVQEVYLGVEV
jgi:branched-chain amino acid transport system ATP-binding protein